MRGGECLPQTCGTPPPTSGARPILNHVHRGRIRGAMHTVMALYGQRIQICVERSRSVVIGMAALSALSSSYSLS